MQPIVTFFPQDLSEVALHGLHLTNGYHVHRHRPAFADTLEVPDQPIRLAMGGFTGFLFAAGKTRHTAGAASWRRSEPRLPEMRQRQLGGAMYFVTIHVDC